jgi:PAS domain-containing protein
MSVEVMAKNNLEVAIALDGNRNVLWGKSIDLTTRKEVAIEGLGGAEWPATHALLGESPKSPIHGVYITPSGPLLVSSTPVIDQNIPGTPTGRFVIGRMLDRQFVSAHFDSGGTGVEMLTASDSRLSKDERDIAQSLIATKTRYLSRTSDEQVLAYATYPDVTGNPGILLRLVIYRTVLAEANDSLQNGLLVQVGIGLSALVVLIVMFRRTVMNPLSRLTAHTIAVAETNDLSSRLGLVRADEIGALGREFDRMVGRLEVDRERQKRDEEALRESEERYILAVRGANDGLWDWNLKTNEVHYSTRWKTLLGHEENEIGSDPDEWFKRIHPEDLENVVSVR